MANRVFVSAVVLLWLCSMGWLFTERILPSLVDGQPPAFETFQSGEAVAWSVEWDGKRVGEAASLRLPGTDGSVELHNRITLRNMPIAELAPAWMRMPIPNLGEMSMDVVSRIEFDPLGKFSAFNSKVSLNSMPSVLTISGRVCDSQLKLNVFTGQLPYEVSIYLPDSMTLHEALFPGAELPNLFLGRHWQEEVYSPFRASGDPIELVHAEVVSQESLQTADETFRVFRVEYHSLFGSGISEKARLQAVSLVEPRGKILRREVVVGSSRLRFDRLSDDDAKKIGDKLFKELLKWEQN